MVRTNTQYSRDHIFMWFFITSFMSVNFSQVKTHDVKYMHLYVDNWIKYLKLVFNCMRILLLSFLQIINIYAQKYNFHKFCKDIISKWQGILFRTVLYVLGAWLWTCCAYSSREQSDWTTYFWCHSNFAYLKRITPSRQSFTMRLEEASKYFSTHHPWQLL